MKQLRDGDIIMLEDGRKARIKLEIFEKVTELKPGTRYSLIYTKSFCSGNSSLINWNEENIAAFVGTVTTSVGIRNVFYAIGTGKYYMFSADSLNYVLSSVK